MALILDLLRLQIDNKTDLFKTASPSKMAKSTFKILLAMLIGIVGVTVLLFRIFSLGIHINSELVAIVLLYL